MCGSCPQATINAPRARYHKEYSMKRKGSRTCRNTRSRKEPLSFTPAKFMVLGDGQTCRCRTDFRPTESHHGFSTPNKAGTLQQSLPVPTPAQLIVEQGHANLGWSPWSEPGVSFGVTNIDERVARSHRVLGGTEGQQAWPNISFRSFLAGRRG